MKVNEKLAFFSKMAAQEAQAQRQEILTNIEERTNAAIDEITAEAEKQARKRLLSEKGKIEQQKNKEVISAITEAKKSAIDLRNSLVEELFESVAKKLREYTATDAYKAKLVSDVIAYAEKYKLVRVYVMERDLSLFDLNDNAIELIGLKEDFIGGFRILLPEKNAVLDLTYLTRLKEERDDFNELKIIDSTRLFDSHEEGI
jgi:vacuolar-type H+-ATPase subunit E/Vma4